MKDLNKIIKYFKFNNIILNILNILVLLIIIVSVPKVLRNNTGSTSAIFLLMFIVMYVIGLMISSTLKKKCNEKIGDKIELSHGIQYSELIHSFNNIKYLTNKVKFNNTMLVKTLKSGFVKKVYTDYYLFYMPVYDEHKIIEETALIEDKYEKKYGYEEYKSGDFKYHNKILIVFIDEWDKNAEKCIHSQIDEEGLWDSTQTYIVYNNGIYYNKNDSTNDYLTKYYLLQIISILQK